MALSEKMKKALFVSAYLRAKAGKPVVKPKASPPAEKHGLGDLPDGLGAGLSGGTKAGGSAKP